MDKYYLVQRNDSILRLAAMTDTEKNKYFEDYIAELKKKDELKREEEEQLATEFLTQTKREAFGNSFDEKDGKFYFYSSTAKSNGESEFRRIWGDRQLRDNWRLSSAGTSIADQKAELTGTTSVNDPRRYDLDFYLEQIPTKPADLTNLKMERDTTELSLGLDYYDKFKDAKLATRTLEHLVQTPPREEDVLLKAYYNLYRVNQEKNPVLAAKYKDLVLNQFPNTIYAEFILNPQKDFSEENSPEVLALYSETYDAYKNEEYQVVKDKANQAFTEFPLAKIIAKFAILNAYADAQLNGVEAYRASLERILILYPGTEEAKHAQYLLDVLDGKTKKDAEPQAMDEMGEMDEKIKITEEKDKPKNNINETNNGRENPAIPKELKPKNQSIDGSGISPFNQKSKQAIPEKKEK